MNKKTTLVILVALFIVSTILGVSGFKISKDLKATPKPEDIKPKVTYEYYLNEELVAEMPAQQDENENSYEFSTFNCDNNMTIEFDSDTWTYTTTNQSNGVCKLYFVRSDYLVELTVTNGLVNGEEASFSSRVVRESDGQFNIVPNEGYEFDGAVSCSNDKEAIYDISTNMLNINSITEDVACKIDFSKRNLKLEIVVKNGTGNTTEEKEYGESVSAIVQPNDGYEKPKIVCTNKQEFTYEDNKLTIAKLTDNSVCTVTFGKTPVVTYTLTINNVPEQVTITSGNKQQTIAAGKDGKFSLRAQEGYLIVLDCNGVMPSTEKTDPDGTITYTFLGMNKNITCNIGVREVEQDTNNGN